MPAKQVHHTETIDRPWDGPGTVANMPNESGVLWYCHAWRDPDQDPETKQAYKFPHHADDGAPANLPACRNGLARLADSKIPDADKPGVERHFRAHLEDAEPESSGSGQDEIETRSYQVSELRISGDGDPELEGIAAVYNQPTVINTFAGEFREVILPGFFDDAINGDVRALWNHNDDYILGRTKNQTLELQDRPDGLGVRIHPPDTTWGRDAVTSIKRGDVDQMSFAFTVKRGWDEWKEDENGTITRYLNPGACKQLFDVSPVTFPAYPQTSVTARSNLEKFTNRPIDPGDPIGDQELELQSGEDRERELELLKRKHRSRKFEIKNQEVKP